MIQHMRDLVQGYAGLASALVHDDTDHTDQPGSVPNG